MTESYLTQEDLVLEEVGEDKYSFRLVLISYYIGLKTKFQHAELDAVLPRSQS